MKTFREFEEYSGALTHTVIDPVTKKRIRVPKGYAVPMARGSRGGGHGGHGHGGHGGGHGGHNGHDNGSGGNGGGDGGE